MRNSFRPVQFVRRGGTRFPRSRQGRPSVYRGLGTEGVATVPCRASALRSPMVIKTEMIKTCPAPRYGERSTVRTLYLSPARQFVSPPCRLNNRINDVSPMRLDFLRDPQRGRSQWRISEYVRCIARSGILTISYICINATVNNKKEEYFRCFRGQKICDVLYG